MYEGAIMYGIHGRVFVMLFDEASAADDVVPYFRNAGESDYIFDRKPYDDVECQNVITEGWVQPVLGRPMFQVSKRIMHTRFALSNWQRSVFGCRSREIDQLRARLQVLSESPLTGENQSKSVSLYSKLDGLLEEENAYWKQRSKITWLATVKLIQPRVTASMNTELCASYSAVEIRAALFQMYPTKALGPDAAVPSFLASGKLLGEINFSYICLIPKVKNPESVADLRPITLCNVIYKICSKVIANRLKKILDVIISPFQSAFIPGRLITYNTLIANDCVTTVRYAFLINGQPRGYLTPSRGLRQGDPLSPYLFLLCTEVFSALLERKASMGPLEGIKVCENAPAIHHLLFADDSLLFGKATAAKCSHIKEVLFVYELASGQQINFAKSSIVFSKKVPELDKILIADSLGVMIESKHEKYLGLPTYLGRNRTDSFAFIKESLSKKLAGWQGKLLSGAGKDLLIRVVAQALPSYSMSCFLLPKDFCDSLHQMCARFWWGSKDANRKIHWLSWEKLCLPKSEGGMGFRDLHAHNLALLAKQGWRIIKNPTSLAPCPRYPSACWRGIFSAKETIAKGLRWQIGDGSSVRIWEDPWIPRPYLFRPLRFTVTPHSQVSELIQNGEWNRELVTEIFSPEDALLMLSLPLSNSRVVDRLIWHYDSKGRFTTKSAYHLAFGSAHSSLMEASSSSASPSFWKCIWEAKVPGKVKVHTWKVCQAILPTLSQLRGRRVPLVGGCYFCNEEDESIFHITVDCPFVRDLIQLVRSFTAILTHSSSNSIADWLQSCYSSLSSEDFAFLLVLLWAVWKERNKRVWNNKFQSLSQVHFQAVTLFQSLKLALSTRTVRVGRRPRLWSPPPSGWFKVNMDGAFDGAGHRGGLGVVVRDEGGQVIAGACASVSVVLSLVLVEAFAGRLACQVVERFGLAPVVFETDCLQDANVLAHKLAKCALGTGLLLSWCGSVPTILEALLST
ncbi:uncharacterized protein LOC133744912 [Rosa rugosa]|uniref:uncharacterized protein LOC133744912 n=1 Tax=Rosa rugosa TaxID=74645 RepID=UPI002B40A811|nr:uncharacterized protein LOC133744912 [Rosa rugosa]